MNVYKYLLLLLSLALLTGCENKDEKIVSPYQNYSGTIQYDGNGKALMECTKFFPKLGSLNGYIKIFKNNQMYYPNKMDVKIFTSLDLNNRILVFYRWKQESNGAFVSDSIPLTFDVNTNGQIYTGYTQFGGSNTTNLNQMTFTVHGTDLSYHALQIAVYNANTSQIEMYSDALLPFFYAHPTDYKATHPNQNLLLNLHPYISEVNSGATQVDFAIRSYSDFCF